MSKEPNPHRNSRRLKRLSVDKMEEDPKRHPSVKGLFDEQGNKIIISKDMINNTNDYFSFKVKVKNGDNTESNNLNENILVQIDKCENKIADNKETFFIENKEYKEDK